MNIDDYQSTTIWLEQVKPNGQPRFSPTTKKEYRRFLKEFCEIANKENPDQLAQTNDMSGDRGRIIRHYSDKRCYKTRNIEKVEGLLNGFWKANGRESYDKAGNIDRHSGIRRDTLMRILQSTRAPKDREFPNDSSIDSI